MSYALQAIGLTNLFKGPYCMPYLINCDKAPILECFCNPHALQYIFFVTSNMIFFFKIHKNPELNIKCTKRQTCIISIKSNSLQRGGNSDLKLGEKSH